MLILFPKNNNNYSTKTYFQKKVFFHKKHKEITFSVTVLSVVSQKVNFSVFNLLNYACSRPFCNYFSKHFHVKALENLEVHVCVFKYAEMSKVLYLCGVAVFFWGYFFIVKFWCSSNITLTQNRKSTKISRILAKENCHFSKFITPTSTPLFCYTLFEMFHFLLILG